MRSHCSVLAAILGLVAFAPWLAAAEPRHRQIRGVHILRDPDGTICDLGFSPDGRRAVTAGGKSVRIWDAKSGKEIAQFTHEGESAYRAAFLPDGKTVAASFGVHAEILLLDATSGKVLSRSPQPRGVHGVVFAPDGRTLVWSQGQSAFRLWEVKTEKALVLRLKPTGDWRFCGEVVFSPDGKIIAVSVDDGSVRLCDATTGAEVRRLFRGINCLKAPRMAFSPDGRFLATDGLEPSNPGPHEPNFGGSVLRLWDVRSGKFVREFRRRAPLLPVLPRTLEESMRARQELITEMSWQSYGLAFSPDGKTLANACCPAQLWEVATGQLRHEFHASASARMVCFSLDGHLLATMGEPAPTGRPGSVNLWNWRDPCLEQPKNLSPRDIERLWGDLASEDAAVGYRAIANLLAHPGPAVEALTRWLRPIQLVTPEELKRLIADLDDNNFSVRERASGRLAALGEAARPELRRVAAAPPSLEVKRRVARLLARPFQPIGLDQLRCLRAVEVLEYIGTEDAQRILRQVAATGAAGAVETEDAKAALHRLDRRGK